MIRVGITGGIGSGKSIVCEVFRKLNVPVFSSDLEARYLTNNDPEIRKGLISLAGDRIFEGQKLDRKLLAKYIFNDKELLAKVNKLIHPRIADCFRNWCLLHGNRSYVIQESAIIFESGANRMMDKIITVSCPQDIRISRVIAREHASMETIMAIIGNQMPEQEKISRSDHIIQNDGTRLVIPQVLYLHRLFSSN